VTKQKVLRIQGTYYVTTGLWPLISMRTFEAVTGPKVDKWLVQMVGLLAATIGGSLLVAAWRDQKLDSAVFTLAIASALSFMSIDIVHSLRRRISPTYLGDAACEAAILALLINSLLCKPKGRDS